MDCPNCGLINPATAQLCDCGYDFSNKTVQKSYVNNSTIQHGFEGWFRWACVGVMVRQLPILVIEAVGFWRASKDPSGNYAIDVHGYGPWIGIPILVAIFFSPLFLGAAIAAVTKRRKALRAQGMLSRLVLLLVLCFVLSMGSCFFTFGMHPLWTYGYR